MEKQNIEKIIKMLEKAYKKTVFNHRTIEAQAIRQEIEIWTQRLIDQDYMIPKKQKKKRNKIPKLKPVITSKKLSWWNRFTIWFIKLSIKRPKYDK